MRVLIAPDSFTGSMTAARAAAAIAEGWHRTAPGDDCVPLPVSDGGPGFVDALAAGLGGRRIPVGTTDPWGNAAAGSVLLVEDGRGRTAYVETAQATAARAGLRGDPGRASSAGVAPLLRAALEAGADRIVVGLGGSLTTDAGAGMLAGLGATASGDAGAPADDRLRSGGLGLASLGAVDLAPARALLVGVEVIIASDVAVPLLGARGAARGFAPQKGADPDLVERLEAALTAFAHACGRTPSGSSPAVALGAGAAGGLGFALLHLGGRRVSGIDAVLEALRFADQVARSDLVVTGEGSFDWQSLHGKVISGVCRAAMAGGRPVLVLAGQIGVGRREWMAVGVSGAFGIIDPDDPRAPADDIDRAIADGPQLLAAVAERAARTWSR